MVCEILSVGTELLLGQVANTDAQYLSQRLSALGISVYRHTVVGDNEARLDEALKLALSRSDTVIMTGGLGPTEDDLTKETMAAHFKRKMLLDAASLTHIHEFMSRAGRPVNENSKKQAMFPEGAHIMPNELGTAPGCVLEADGKLCAVLPGPPRELKRMFENYLQSYLEARTDSTLYSRYLHIFGLGEPVVENMLSDLFHLGTPTLALYCSVCEVTARISALIDKRARPDKAIDDVAREIKRRVGDALYAEGLEESMASTVKKMLASRGETVAMAESCTGGLLASALVDLPGASNVLGEGYVTYSNASKSRILGVKPETLEKYGAVSRECALEMALGARALSKADWALSVTGIAGPDGATRDKPVGLVYMAIAGARGASATERLFSGGRDNVRIASVKTALNTLRLKMLEYDGHK